MSDVYLLESSESFEDATHVQGVFSSIEKAQAYAAVIAGRALEWETDQEWMRAHVAYPLAPGADYHSVDAYYINVHTLDPEPTAGDDE